MAEDSERSVLDRVTAVTVEVLKLDASKVSLSSDLRNDLGADSVDLITLVFALEEEFNAKIPEEEMWNIKTVGEVVDLIESHKVKSE